MPDAAAKQVSEGVEEALRDIGTQANQDVTRFAPPKYRADDTLAQLNQDFRKQVQEYKRRLEEHVRRADEMLRLLG